MAGLVNQEEEVAETGTQPGEEARPEGGPDGNPEGQPDGAQEGEPAGRARRRSTGRKEANRIARIAQEAGSKRSMRKKKTRTEGGPGSGEPE